MLSMSTVSGSVPNKPIATAISVACPFPVRQSEPYRYVLMCFTWSKTSCSSSSAIQRSAARHGPSVCELEGPTPILSISNRLMHSIKSIYSVKYSKLNEIKMTIFKYRSSFFKNHYDTCNYMVILWCFDNYMTPCHILARGIIIDILLNETKTNF